MDAKPVAHDPFGSGEITRLSPTTEPQREIIAAAMMSSEANTAYNEAVSVRIRGFVPTELLQTALRTLVERHDALRTTFTPDLDVLCVSTDTGFRLHEVEIVAGDEAEREAAVRELWHEVATTPMSLFTGPLFQARLLRFGANDAELVLLAHHAVCDGWSFHVLLQGLSSLCTDNTLPLPPAQQFAAFAEQQGQREGNRADLDYWLRRFADQPAALDLPTDRPRPARRTFRAHRVDRRFAASTTKLMASAAGSMRASAMNVLLGGVSALFHRLTDAVDVTLGMPVARQALDELPSLVGHCVQLLPVRVAVEETLRFDQLVAAAKSAVLDATEHFDCTFNSLVRELGLSGDAARVPLIPVLVNIDQPLAKLKLGKAQGTVRTVPRTAEGFEIFFNVLPDVAGWSIETTFNCDLYADETIASWLMALENLLIAGCTDPAAPVRSLKVAPDVEAGFPSTERELHYEVWLAPFLRLAAQRATATAVIDADGETSFGDLARRAAGVADELVQHGVRRGDIVGLCTTRSRDLLVAMLGIHMAGAAYVPLDPDFPEARLRFQLEDTAAKVVVADRGTAPLIANLGVATIDAGRATGTAPEVMLPQPEDLAYVLYTSGSTGKPKGVRVQHRPLANLLASVISRPGFTSSDTLLAVTTIAFDISLLELLVPLVAGGRLVVLRREQAEDPQALAALLERHDVTVMQATPATWQLLLENEWAGRSSLRAFCGGERLRPDLAAMLLPRVHSLWNLYGPTETCVWSAGAQVVASETASLVGTPFDNTRIVVLDRSGVMLPPGMPGEICIGGAGLAQSYQNLPQLTAERFVDHLELGRLYRTGDRGRIRPSGVLECLGRMDQQIKLRGFRIELGEIEAALGSHAQVVEAAVLLDDATASGARLVAYVACRPPAPSTTALKDHLRASLPDYMVPQQIVQLPALPRLPNGKLDRRSLPRVGPLDEQQQAIEIVEPGNDIERIVLDAMREVLGEQRLGIEHGFFDVGGHSLLAAQLVARLNRACDVQLTLRSVFEAPTSRELASVIESGTSGSSAARRIERRPDQRHAPVTHQQERIWFMHQMLPAWPAYNLPSAHRLRGPFDADLFRRALQAVVDRQPSLRTTFERNGGQLRQVVHDTWTVDLGTIEDLSELPATEREARLAHRLDQLTAEPFDLAQLPLFRARLFRLTADEHVFFFMPHHIVWDGWSFDVLYGELSALYGAFCAGEPNPLPELPISYGDFAAWHRDLQAGPDGQRQAAWWRERLVRFGRVQPLPADGRRSQGMSGAGATQSIAIDATRTRALHELGREHGATMFLTTLAIYSVLLHDYARAARLLLATPIRGRESADLESVMGCCNSLLPLPIDVQPEDTFAALLRRTKASVLDSFAHPDVVLEQVDGAHHASNGNKGGSNAGGVLYQALFSFQDVRQRNHQWGPLEHSMIHVFQKGATEDLGLWFVEGGGGLQGGLTHNTRVLSAATAVRLRDRFLEIVDEVIQAPSAPIAALVGRLHRTAADANGVLPIVESAAPAGEQDQAHECEGANKEEIRDFEFILTQIWRQVLGVQEIGVHDDFFQLGGNSLGAIRCVTEFESATGIRLDLGELFRTPTIAALARSVSEGVPRAASMLIPLHGGGDGAPVFCLLGIQVYRHFASALGDKHPVFGVYVREEQALVGRPVQGELPVASIEKLAASYVEIITNANAKGPLHLAGMSLGGVVAMEVARRLTERGVQVQAVFLLDTILPTGYRSNWLRRLRDSVLGDAIVHFAGRLGLRKRPMLEQELGVEKWSSRQARRRYAAAMDREVMRWQDGYPRPDWPVVLLRAKDNAAWGSGIVLDSTLGWRRTVGEQLTVIEVEGDHVGILAPPQVHELAARVRPHLR